MMNVNKSLLLLLVASFCFSALGFSFFGRSKQGRNDPQISDTTYRSGKNYYIREADSYPLLYNSDYDSGIRGNQYYQSQYSSFSSSGASGSSSDHGENWEGGDVDISDQFTEEEHFSFTLKEPLFDRVSRDDAVHYREPGWTISDSRNREVDVMIDVPIGMRRQRIGKYNVTYKAFLRDSDYETPLSIQERVVQVYDINECELGTHDCSANGNCIYLESGGYKCECKTGYRGSGKICNDIDECAEGSAICDIHATCMNTDGGYVCECNPGFVKGEDDICIDIDECETGANDCSQYADCLNLPGHFQCKCKDGYEGDGKDCSPVNKCETGDINCHPYSNCLTLEEGGFKCECKSGFRGDGIHVCEDIDECEENKFTCSEHSHCRNTFGSYVCACDSGFEEIDGKCEDIKECSQSNICPSNSKCFEEIGGYHCLCEDGFKETEDGHCEDMTGVPQLTLKGDNPMVVDLFDTFSEPGFLIEDEKEEMSLIVRIPPKLHGTARHCGEFNITYTAKDLTNGKIQVKTREVIVAEVDQCKLDPSHPFSAKCHDFARCVHLTGKCDYTCQCPTGYVGNGFGPKGCSDGVPPEILYNGPEPYIREECIVCGTTIAKPNLAEPVLTKAYDYTPFGKKDLSDRIELVTEESDMEGDCLLHIYTVRDDSENVGTRNLTVCLQIEDMRTTIMEMKAMYSWQMWIIRNVAFLCVLAFVLFCVWEFGHYLASCFRVLLNADPSHDDKDSAYSMWYRLTHPLASRASVRKYVNQKVLLDDEPEVDDFDSDEDSYYSDSE